MIDCPCCNRLLPPMSWQLLAAHIAQRHLGAYFRVQCWCGERWRVDAPEEVKADGLWPMGDFAIHLKNEGGALTHLLAVRLGEDH